MLRPIFAQKHSRKGSIGPRLRDALLWWRNVLSNEVSELREWNMSSDKPVFLFVDAASTPARCAAVLASEGHFSYTAMDPPSAMLVQLKERRDNQITSLEIIAIFLALSTFVSSLEGRCVVLYSDNTGLCSFMCRFILSHG
jgi:hypothetical protein